MQCALVARGKPGPQLGPREARPAQRFAARRRTPLLHGPKCAASAASKGGDGAAPGQPARKEAAPRAAAAAPPPPAAYPDALLQREYELWQRQAELYESARAAHDADRERWAAERAGWQAQEAALRQEAAELRAQLLYVMAQLGAAQGAAGAGAPSVGSVAPMPVPPIPQAATPGTLGAREPAAALPSSGDSSGGGLSPAEQVQAAVEAMKFSGSAASSGASSGVSPVSASAAWPAGADSERPSFAADLAAAVAAVDNTDVLAGVSMYTSGARQAASASSSSASSSPEPAAAPAPAPAPPPPQPAEPEAAVEASPRGPPPTMMLGADDIFWVNQLHTALTDLGYYPGDDDIDTFFFGEGTQSALMTMQCCEGLEETGLTDDPTWARLLGPELTLKPSRDLTADMMLNVPGLSKLAGGGGGGGGDGGASAAATQQQAGAGAGAAYSELFSAAFSESVSPGPDGGLRDVQELVVSDSVALPGGKTVTDSLAARSEVAVSADGTAARVSSSVSEQVEVSLKTWPVLMEGDGGQEVHALHIALQKAGYYPSEDDIRWWTFSDGTLAALKTFQACAGYPESGVCDANTWRKLLGEDAQPNDILRMRSGESDDDDLAAESKDRVWLIGEQRWENRDRMNKG